MAGLLVRTSHSSLFPAAQPRLIPLSRGAAAKRPSSLTLIPDSGVQPRSVVSFRHLHLHSHVPKVLFALAVGLGADDFEGEGMRASGDGTQRDNPRRHGSARAPAAAAVIGRGDALGNRIAFPDRFFRPNP